MRRWTVAILLGLLVAARATHGTYAPVAGTVYVPDGEAEYGSWININNEPDYLRIWRLRDSEGVYKLWVGFATGTESAMKVYKEVLAPAPTSTVTIHPTPGTSQSQTFASATGSTGTPETTGTVGAHFRRSDEAVLYERDPGQVGIDSAVGSNYWQIDLLLPKPMDGWLFLRYDGSEFQDASDLIWGFSGPSIPLTFVSGADYTLYDSEANAILAFVPFADLPSDVSQFVLALFRNTTMPAASATVSSTSSLSSTTASGGSQATGAPTTGGFGGTVAPGSGTSTTVPSSASSTSSSGTSATSVPTATTTRTATTTDNSAVRLNSTAAMLVAALIGLLLG
ncbi:hypothetical protein DFJ74DRAFT_150478 [Hyaloraphidium curvatum]|nr:hypothetical protein DFJ74DRAFT_150478 [Hyaloraphidium curvatum]